MKSDKTEKTIRLDKWLKIALILKTRSQATKACEEGRVKVNDQIAKPAKLVKIGDTINVKFKWHSRTFDVLEISHKNLSAKEAKLLYREHEKTAEEKEAEELRQAFFEAERKFRRRYKGRPTKKERRRLEHIRGY
ncbi:MAG: RNA-binding S4 domain-containing protein [candidate division KSB1 bacterium]|nr:RNA-binding S4 domain-containing protein [candidate division KSB1 bacterium]